MLELERSIKITPKTIRSPNLCDRFSDDDLTKIGDWCWENFDRDNASRESWTKRMGAAMDLALQVQTQKNFPWAGCANIKFPLVTIAALQFHARAYPEIINGRSVVETRVIGPDPTGSMGEVGRRIAGHMSWQLLEQDESWEEDQDRALLNIAIVGCGFKKSYYDSSVGHNVSKFIMAQDLVVDYYARSINEARVKTHILPMYRNDILERVHRGTFANPEDYGNNNWLRTDAQPRRNILAGQDDQRNGTKEPQSNSNTPYTMLEQHCWLDLDKDGYEEPYIITFEESSHCVVRIVSRISRPEDVERDNQQRIIKINAEEYFTKMPFIPNPDGSLMDIGFGILLGPLNESVNSAINQLFDAGTLANTSGGFLGRGAKIRGGIYEFSPFSWNRVDSSGDDLRKSLVPMPIREPSAVMFQLLGLLIDYTNRISGATDMLTGVNPGQNTPAETARSMVEQGQKVYSAIFKRVWRSMKMEFKKLMTLNAIYLPNKVIYGSAGESISRDDYLTGAVAVVPVADPLIASDAARFAQARLIREAAGTAAGYNRDEVEKRFLRTLKVDDIDTIFIGSDKTPPPIDVRLQIAQLKNQEGMLKLQLEKMKFTATLTETMRLNNAKIAELQASTAKLMAEAESEPQKQQINAFNAAANMLKEQNASLNSQVLQILKGMTDDTGNLTGIAAGVPALEGVPANEGALQLGAPEAGGLEGAMG